MGHAPPVLRLALAFSAGAAWVHAGVPIAPAPLVALAWLLWPNRASPFPERRLLWTAVALLGAAAAWLGRPAERCAPAEEGHVVTLEGRFLASPRGGSAAFERDAGCGTVTAVLADSTARAGEPVHLVGTWRVGPGGRAWFLARSAAPGRGEGFLRELRWLGVRWRDGLVARLDRLYGTHAPLVSALVLARAEGFDADLREAYARAGIAHMLAISGYHVGVIAALVLASLRACGRTIPQSAIGAALVAWAYVGFIGFPDAALRAALMVALAAISRARTRPPARWGTFGAALLLLVAADPRRIASPGFQLSFAGVAGLVAWCAPLNAAIHSCCRKLFGRACNKDIALGVAAGVGATAATLPFVAWHFERVSLVGIPATVVATPLIAWALVGSIGSLALDFVWPAGARFLAGGVELTLVCLDRGATVAAAWPWASVWTTRASVVAGCVGVLVAGLVALHPRVHARGRRILTAVYVATATIAWPFLLSWQGRGSLELLMIDVGQGDAIAARTASGRWLLVDAGPPADGDPGGHPVVRALSARGVRRIDALVLTHAHLDHIGGATAVLGAFDVGTIYDPGVAASSQEYVDVLELAASRGIPWRAVHAGDSITVSGLQVSVLAPRPDAPGSADLNTTSVVLRVVLGDFDALLTGDAYTDVEYIVADELRGGLEVLKVGHHGSETSTDSLLLSRVDPGVALISAGRYNRYGHPDPDVLRLLERNGTSVWRTDRQGTVAVRARRDGSYTVSAERPVAGGPAG